MKTKLIAIVSAIAFATTGLATAPAQADDANNIVRFLVGAAVIGAIVNAANQNNRRTYARSDEFEPEYRQRYRQNYRTVPVQRQHIVKRRGNKPNTCLFQRWTQRGWKTFYGRRCMTRLGWNRDNRGWYQNRVVYW